VVHLAALRNGLELPYVERAIPTAFELCCFTPGSTRAGASTS